MTNHMTNPLAVLRMPELDFHMPLHSCPADRGDAGYQGTVTSVGEPLPGKSYRWVEVQHPLGTKHVWPSNRLG